MRFRRMIEKVLTPDDFKAIDELLDSRAELIETSMIVGQIVGAMSGFMVARGCDLTLTETIKYTAIGILFYTGFIFIMLIVPILFKIVVGIVRKIINS